jgi:hypothetical protein
VALTLDLVRGGLGLVEGLCNGSILGGRLLSGGLARDVEGG